MRGMQPIIEWYSLKDKLPPHHETIIIQPYANVNAGVPVAGYYDKRSNVFGYWEYEGTGVIHVEDVLKWSYLPMYVPKEGTKDDVK